MNVENKVTLMIETETQTIDPVTINKEVQTDTGQTITKESGKFRPKRTTYLVTYSQADLELVPTRASFAELVAEAFNKYRAGLKEFAVALEPHPQTGGVHYHMSVRLDKQVPFSAAAEFLRDKGIFANFSINHENYYSAWKYVTEEDKEALLSPGHEIYDTPPRTARASRKRLCAALEDVPVQATDSNKKAVPRRLRREEVAEIVVQRGLKTSDEFMAYAQNMRNAGNPSIWSFNVSIPRSENLESFINKIWQQENSLEAIARKKKSRCEILREELSKQCVKDCCGRWERAAREVLAWNNIDAWTFTSAIWRLLEKGRGKGRNMILTGPGNCGKTFLFAPLDVIYDCFHTPATGTFAWVDVEVKEVIFLNDFRWCPKLMAWAELLALLEGAAVHIAAPKTTREKDILFRRDTPIFATSVSKVHFMNERGSICEPREQEMMDIRWLEFRLFRTVPDSCRVQIPPCGRCFSSLVINCMTARV